MDKISLASGCDALNTTAQEAQCNVQTLPATMKQCAYMSLKSPNCLNYYDGQFSASIELKEEFPEDECPQSSTAASCINRSGIYSNIVFENQELSKVLERHEIKQEKSEEALSFIKTEENHDEKDKFVAKTEMSDEYRIPSNAGDTSLLYKVRTIPQEIQFTMCGGKLKDGSNLLTHNNEHIKIEPLKLVGYEENELHKCQFCDEYFNHDNMLAHVNDVHSHKKHKSELFHKSTLKVRAGRNVDKINYKCDFCKRIYKSKAALVSHLKKIHYSYGSIYECWCGEQFSTPRHLYNHQSRQHDTNAKTANNVVLKTEFQCDICKKLFNKKGNLKRHITSLHYDYGKTFECRCGEQFPTPRHLYKHKNRYHDAIIISTNNEALKSEFQCHVCKKMFKLKGNLKKHILSIHCDYDKSFECWCGQQFRTPIHLYQHKYKRHGTNINGTNDAALKKVFQCEFCKKMFKYKGNLKQHILGIHCDYGKTFKCWCGKQFTTPIHLSRHKAKQHGANVKRTNVASLKKEYQCDVCKKIFKCKSNLKQHILSIHCDYGKTFECWCGKQFTTPIHLYQHKNKQHGASSKGINAAALKKEFQCDFCNKRFKLKGNLKQHILSIHCDYE